MNALTCNTCRTCPCQDPTTYSGRQTTTRETASSSATHTTLLAILVMINQYTITSRLGLSDRTLLPRYGCRALASTAAHRYTALRPQVLTGDGAVVAQLDWSAHDQLGTATIQGREQFMSYMVMKGKTPSYVRRQSDVGCGVSATRSSIRIFELNRHLFEWRRQEQTDAYDVRTISS